MKIITIDECHSTQDELKNQISTKFEPMVVITKNQTKGKGQRERSWHHFENSLAMSFSFKPSQIPTMTPLKLGVLLCEYFEKKDIDLKLKWPNDLIIDDKKCGGILCEYINEEIVLVGLGLNLFETEKKKFEYPHGFLDISINAKELMIFLYEDHLNKDFTSEFMKRCVHQNKEVEVDGKKGIFKGIGAHGEALIQHDLSEPVKKYYSARLRYL